MSKTDTVEVNDVKSSEKFLDTWLLKPVEERKADAQKILDNPKMANRVPTIVDRGDMNAPKLDKNKYIVPNDHTVQSFYQVLRKRMIEVNSENTTNLKPEETIHFMFGRGANAKVVDGSKTFGEVYSQMKDSEDNFLYIMYFVEATLG